MLRRYYLKKEDYDDWEPRMYNRADGVDGHYCIGRRRPDGYHEFWHHGLQKWCSAGSVFELGRNPSSKSLLGKSNCLFALPSFSITEGINIILFLVCFSLF